MSAQSTSVSPPAVSPPAESSAPASGLEQPQGNSGANATLASGAGGGDATGGDDPSWWKTAPKLNIPWPPGTTEGSGHEIGWDNGPSYRYAFPEVELAKRPLFEMPPISVQTPVPGVLVDLFASAEFGLKVGGSLGMQIQKEGEGKYKATGSGTVAGTAAVGVKGGVGLAAGVPGLSMGVAGDLAATVELVLTGSVELSVTYQNGAWSGSVAAPMSFVGAIKVTPSASLYVNLFSSRTDLATFSFGEWTIATAGIEWRPQADFGAGGVTNATQQPRVIGPTWGRAPEPQPT